MAGEKKCPGSAVAPEGASSTRTPPVRQLRPRPPRLVIADNHMKMASGQVEQGAGSLKNARKTIAAQSLVRHNDPRQSRGRKGRRRRKAGAAGERKRVIDTFKNLNPSDQKEVAKQLGLDAPWEKGQEEDVDGVGDIVLGGDRTFDDAVPDNIPIGHDVMEVEEVVVEPTVCRKLVEGFPSQ